MLMSDRKGSVTAFPRNSRKGFDMALNTQGSTKPKGFELLSSIAQT